LENKQLFNEAIDKYLEIIVKIKDKDPFKTALAKYYIAQIYFNKKDWDKAIYQLEGALKICPQERYEFTAIEELLQNSYSEKGEELKRNKKFDEAINWFSKIVLLNTNNSWIDKAKNSIAEIEKLKTQLPQLDNMLANKKYQEYLKQRLEVESIYRPSLDEVNIPEKGYRIFALSLAKNDSNVSKETSLIRSLGKINGDIARKLAIEYETKGDYAMARYSIGMADLMDYAKSQREIINKYVVGDQYDKHYFNVTYIGWKQEGNWDENYQWNPYKILSSKFTVKVNVNTGNIELLENLGGGAGPGIVDKHGNPAWVSSLKE